MSMTVPQGTFALERLHASSRGLRAWDAADEYLLSEFDEWKGAHGSADAGHTLLLNDTHGALATAFVAAGEPCATMVETAEAEAALTANFDRCGLDPEGVAMVRPLEPLSEAPARVVMKLPVDLGLLQAQLEELAPQLTAGTLLVAGAMTRNLRTATMELVAQHGDSVQTTLARKKARLLTAQTAGNPPAATWPRQWAHAGIQTVNHGGVFSAEQLDVGTRVLLDSLPADASGVCVDLGCGNGIVGASLAAAAEHAEVVLVDNQHRAVASALATWRANHGDRPVATAVRDGLMGPGSGAGFGEESVDLVLCNPPFHDGAATTDAIAWRMFTESRRALRPGGELRIVGNRHLGYHAKLQKIFGNCEVVASVAKFSVLSARR